MLAARKNSPAPLFFPWNFVYNQFRVDDALAVLKRYVAFVAECGGAGAIRAADVRPLYDQVDFVFIHFFILL